MNVARSIAVLSGRIVRFTRRRTSLNASSMQIQPMLKRCAGPATLPPFPLPRRPRRHPARTPLSFHRRPLLAESFQPLARAGGMVAPRLRVPPMDLQNLQQDGLRALPVARVPVGRGQTGAQKLGELD